MKNLKKDDEELYVGFGTLMLHTNETVNTILNQLIDAGTLATKKEIEKNKRLYKTYGITINDWNRMLREQEGVCWICQTLPKSGILCVDHRHVPKYKHLGSKEKAREVRGLLCFSCNTGLHGLEKRKNARFLFNRVFLYFEKFKIKGDI